MVDRHTANWKPVFEAIICIEQTEFQSKLTGYCLLFILMFVLCTSGIRYAA